MSKSNTFEKDGKYYLKMGDDLALILNGGYAQSKKHIYYTNHYNEDGGINYKKVEGVYF